MAVVITKHPEATDSAKRALAFIAELPAGRRARIARALDAGRITGGEFWGVSDRTGRLSACPILAALTESERDRVLFGRRPFFEAGRVLGASPRRVREFVHAWDVEWRAEAGHAPALLAELIGVAPTDGGS